MQASSKATQGEYIIYQVYLKIYIMYNETKNTKHNKYLLVSETHVII